MTGETDCPLIGKGYFAAVAPFVWATPAEVRELHRQIAVASGIKADATDHGAGDAWPSLASITLDGPDAFRRQDAW